MPEGWNIDELSVLERITRSIQAALEEITIDNGYHADVKEVRRATLLGVQKALSDRVIDFVAGVGIPLADQGSGIQEWDQPYFIDIGVSPSELDETPIETYINTLAQDVVKVVLEGAKSRWVYDGEKMSTDTLIAGAGPLQRPDGSYIGYGLEIKVTYRTKEFDPFKLPSE